jgi:putative transposase
VWEKPHQLVFEVKYLRVLLGEEVIAMIEETARENADWVPIEIETIGIDKNDIHLFCGAHPRMAPGQIVQIFKNLTARRIF